MEQNAPKVGERAPEFEAESTHAKISLRDYAGKYLVIYFYPKDMTPGCTTQANEFSALYGRFKELNAEVLGVSRDTVPSHKLFCEKESIAFPLISDVDSKVCNLYGVLKEKIFFVKKYIGIVRSTFLINKHQIISKVWSDVKARGHATKVLEAVKLMKTNDQ